MLHLSCRTVVTALPSPPPPRVACPGAAPKAQNAVLEEELQRSQGALHDAAIKLDGLGRELHFAEDGQEHLRALERMVKEHLPSPRPVPFAYALLGA